MKQACEECNRTFGHDKGCSFDGASFQWERQNPKDTEITIVTGKGSWKTILEHPSPPRYEPVEEITTTKPNPLLNATREGREERAELTKKYFKAISEGREIFDTPERKKDFIAGLIVLGVMVGLAVYAGLELL